MIPKYSTMIDDKMTKELPTIEALLRLIENGAHMARHVEEQRATMTNFLITISGLLVAVVAQQRFAPSTLVISLLIVALGLFGISASLKYAQHFHYHYSLSKFYQHRLHQLVPEANILKVKSQAIERNMQNYPFLRKRLSIVYMWLFLHGSICIIGIACIVLNVLSIYGYTPTL